MTISLDTSAPENLRKVASQGQHGRVIMDSKVICQLLVHHFEMLDIQARSYVARAQLTTALEIATTMQEINPASALGYLSQGYIHMEQGRYLTAAVAYAFAYSDYYSISGRLKRIPSIYWYHQHGLGASSSGVNLNSAP
ncbi:hypothetical protein K492DRAFT_200287 [Lichtheimia hyalospora FSU 10163]|nr:hypothetical protein K492DRAFT_200287 [Lichtheimia hyalospora FSU 10163]